MMSVAYGPPCAFDGTCQTGDGRWYAPAGATRGPIDLDHHATTPVDPEVLAVMLPFFRERHGNTASPHQRGRDAADALEQARADVAGLLGADPAEVLFTSGATESNNHAIVGTVLATGGRGHVVSSPTEHSCVLRSLDVVRRMGGQVTMLQVDAAGRVDPAELARVLDARRDTVLVSVMHGNNETGTLQPVSEVARVCRERDVTYHCDMAQSFGRVPLDVADLPDLVTVCAHKLYGPQGIGALRIRTGTPVAPIIVGGTQERGRRAGTVNLAGAVGFGWACRILRERGTEIAAREASLRDLLLQLLLDGLGPDVVHVNGPLDEPGNGLPGWQPVARLPHNLHVTMLGVCPRSLAKALEGVVNVSSASACRGGRASSHVLAAMHAPDDGQGAPVRFGVGRFTKEAEIRQAAAVVVDAVRQLHGRGCAIPGARSRAAGSILPGRK